MSIPADWQTTRPTIRERTKFMLNSNRLSDVKFVVRSDGESESEQVIPAHKFLLSIGSPVFEAMFYGDLAETKDTIELPDCDYKSLLELLRYMYSDEVNLSGSNVMGVLYLAKKYMVPSLVDKCIGYLQEEVDSSNVFNILPFAQKYGEDVIVDRCWEVIDDQTDAAVKSDAFDTIERSLLEAVVTRDTLEIKEVALFQAVNRWATTQCEKQGTAADGDIKRGALGEKIIKAIRFPVMTMEEFAAEVVDTDILTASEIISLFQFFAIQTSPVGFSKTTRKPRVVYCRLGRSMRNVNWYVRSGREVEQHGLGIVVDKNIKLHGVRLLGRENECYRVILEVKDKGNNYSTIAFKSGIYYSSEHFQCESLSCNGFEVLFDSAACIKKNTMYHIVAKITGEPPGCSVKGSDSLEVSGVNFRFTGIVGSITSIDCSPFFAFQIAV